MQLVLRERNMKRFGIGLATGLLLGLASLATAQALEGGPHALVGWDVTRGRETICADPWVYPDDREIVCDRK